MLNVRLNQEEEKKLQEYSQENDMTKTQVVKEALAMYYSKNDMINSPYKLGADLFGKADGGGVDYSTTYKQRIKDKFREKNSH